MRVKTKYDIGDKVNIDGDSAIRGTVLSVTVHATGEEYKVGWMHNGTSQWGDFDEFRLSYAPNESR